MYKKKRVESRYYIIILFIVVAIFLGILFMVMKDDRKLSLPEKALKDSVLFVQKIVTFPVRVITDKIDEMNEKNKLYDRYVKMRDKVDQMDSLEVKYKQAKEEIKELKQLLELNHSLSEYTYLNATVVNRNLDYWYQTITLDQGSKNGVEEGMAVITNHGLIGKVTKTTNFNCTVKLLTSSDQNNKLSVKIETENGYIYGLLTEYDEQEKTYIIEGIAENTEVKEGAKVVTTGLGNAFPSGLLLGTVESIETDHFELARSVHVKASVNFDQLEYVTILKRKVEA